jgi:hypothetical protein
MTVGIFCVSCDGDGDSSSASSGCTCTYYYGGEKYTETVSSSEMREEGISSCGELSRWLREEGGTSVSCVSL